MEIYLVNHGYNKSYKVYGLELVIASELQQFCALDVSGFS